MYCARRCGCPCDVAQRKPDIKYEQISTKTNSQSSGRNCFCRCKSEKNSPRIEITRHNRNSWYSSEARLPLKDMKNTKTLSVATARKSTSPATKVKCYSTYSVTRPFNSIGPSSYIKEAFKNKDSKKIIKKKVVSPKPTLEKTAFSKEIIVVKNNFKYSEHHTIKNYAPVLKIQSFPHYPKTDYDQLGYIFDGVPTDSVGTPSEQDTPSCNLLRNIEVVAVDGKEELLPFNFLQDVRERIGSRTTLVDWLVKVQNYFDAGNSVLFMVIKIFDKLLARHKIENNKFQLYATAAFWICYKHYNSEDPISAPDLLKLTINKYSVNELLMTAKNILQFLNYKLHSDLQICHVYSFVCVILKLSENNDVYNCAHFFLEILLLDPNCNCYAVSLQACAAVYLALKLFNYNESYFEMLDTAYWSHKPSEMTEIHKKIIEFVLLMSDSQYRYRNSFLKYSTDRYGQISEKVAKIIIAL